MGGCWPCVDEGISLATFHTKRDFLTLDSSTRALLASLAVGLEELVAITRADEQASDYHLHGYGYLSSDCTHLAVACAFETAGSSPSGVECSSVVPTRGPSIQNLTNLFRQESICHISSISSVDRRDLTSTPAS